MTAADRRCSVVIANHNYGRFLDDAIDSALATGRHTEVIVVDDGSTDDSASVLARYGDRITGVLKPNGGQASALNIGFEHAAGGAVIFLDADDMLEPTAADSVLDALDDEAIHVHWPMRNIGADGSSRPGLRPKPPLPNGDLRPLIRRKGPGPVPVVPTSGNAFRREFLESVFPIPEDPFRNGGIDLYLSWLAAATAPVVALPVPQSRYRRHGGGDSVTGSTDERIDRALRWVEHAFAAVANRLNVPPDELPRWRKNEWWHGIEDARREIRATVPPAAPILVADDYAWAVRHTFADRPVCQLAADDAFAVDRGLIDRTAEAMSGGISHLVVAPSSTWWVRSFPEWAEWLESHASILVRSHSIEIYRLRSDDG